MRTKTQQKNELRRILPVRCSWLNRASFRVQRAGLHRLPISHAATYATRLPQRFGIPARVAYQTFLRHSALSFVNQDDKDKTHDVRG